MATDYSSTPDNLPAPEDDGAARHLTGAHLPDIGLPSTAGGAVELAALEGRSVVYIYPRTGVPGQPSPGRRLGHDPRRPRLHAAILQLPRPPWRARRARRPGVRTQHPGHRLSARGGERLHLPFALLSDADLRLTRALTLPTLRVADVTLLRRMGLVIRDGVIETVFYPVFPPGAHAEEMLAWLRQNPA